MKIYRFADVNVGIETVHPQIHSFWSEYVTEGPADFTVRTTEADIRFERGRAEQPVASDESLENLAVYRKIAEKMPERDVFLFHGSAVAVDGKAYVFTALSGIGKSTHARLWREMLGDRAVMVNDDKPLIRVRENGAMIVYGTPWDGKHHLSSNISVPVFGICFLERSEINRIREMSRAEALPMLIRQTYRPLDPAALDRTLMLIDRMRVRMYLLSCNMERSAAELSFRTMHSSGD